MKNRRSKIIFISIIGVILLLFFILGYFPRYFSEKKAEKLSETNYYPRVSVQEIHAQTTPSILILPSSAQAFHVTPIWARANGYLEKLHVDIGDVVKEGDLLAELDTPEVDQQYDQAVAELESAIARRDLAQIQAVRWQNLFEKNKEAVPKSEVDDRVQTFYSAEADVDSAEKNAKRLRYLQQYKKILAPFNGIISKRDIDIGSLITAGSNGSPQELFQITQANLLRFFVDVPQTFYPQIKVGLDASLHVKEFPNRTFKGTVTRTAMALDPNARTLNTEVDVINEDLTLLPGIYAEVKFVLNPFNQVFIVSTDSVIIRAQGTQIAVVDENDVVHIRPVTIGRDNGRDMEITTGLKDGDKIVLRPTTRIREGVKVIINKE